MHLESAIHAVHSKGADPPGDPVRARLSPVIKRMIELVPGMLVRWRANSVSSCWKGCYLNLVYGEDSLYDKFIYILLLELYSERLWSSMIWWSGARAWSDRVHHYGTEMRPATCCANIQHLYLFKFCSSSESMIAPLAHRRRLDCSLFCRNCASKFGQLLKFHLKDSGTHRFHGYI